LINSDEIYFFLLIGSFKPEGCKEDTTSKIPTHHITEHPRETEQEIMHNCIQPQNQNRERPLNSAIEPDPQPPKSPSICTANWTEIDTIFSKFQANISTIKK